MEKLAKLKIILCLISSISCIYNIVPSDGKYECLSRLYLTNQLKLRFMFIYIDAASIDSTKGVVGLLNNDEFNFTALVLSNSSTNPLPLKIKIGGHCFGTNLNIILNRVTDFRSQVKTQIWTENLTPATSERTVIK